MGGRKSNLFWRDPRGSQEENFAELTFGFWIPPRREVDQTKLGLGLGLRGSGI